MDKWDETYISIADTFAGLSSAKRAKVGAVIVRAYGKSIIGVGYNGMPSGWTNECEDYYTMIREDGERIIESKTKPEVLHAEANAIMKVAQSTESTFGATIYCTMLPCLDCAKLIYQAGIKRVVYRDSYPKGTAGLEFLQKCDILVEHYVQCDK